jgi:hypothetical protein
LWQKNVQRGGIDVIRKFGNVNGVDWSDELGYSGTPGFGGDGKNREYNTMIGYGRISMVDRCD